MHPLLTGRLRTFLYAAALLGVAIGLTALLARLDNRPFFHTLAFLGPLTLVYGSICLSAWYVCKHHPIESTPLWRLAPTLITAALQGALVWVGLGTVWALLLTRQFGLGPDRAHLFHDLVFLFVAGNILYMESIALHYVLLIVENARIVERRLLESQVTAREAELRALRAQLNPHFLFNSLNSISALTGPDPEAARHMCHLLGDFLRQSLSLGARERVPFAEELALAERYLSIEQVRFGARLGFEKRIDPDAERCLVPPLLIQPLVENAVKHGVADRVDGGVVFIDARREDGSLVIEVENPRDPAAPPRRGQGLGLDNVKRRLDALDPRGTRVDVFRAEEQFRVVLTLPAVEAESVAPAAASPARAPASAAPAPPLAPEAPARQDAPSAPSLPARETGAREGPAHA